MRWGPVHPAQNMQGKALLVSSALVLGPRCPARPRAELSKRKAQVDGFSVRSYRTRPRVDGVLTGLDALAVGACSEHGRRDDELVELGEFRRVISLVP
eukprot:SAG11_NODE_136_length_15118_cov_14.188495_7_plen_98_part_00